MTHTSPVPSVELVHASLLDASGRIFSGWTSFFLDLVEFFWIESV